MAPIPFPVSSAPGVKPQEGAGRLINCRASKTEQGARFPVLWSRCAGLRELVEITDFVHLRGGIAVGTTSILALDTRAYSLTESGGVFTATNLGALGGTDQITVAKNNAATPNVVAVTTAGAFNLFPASAPTAFADADLPQPNSVTQLSGYLTFSIGDGRIFATGLNNVSVATNSFTTAQKRSGGLLRVQAFRDELFAFGPSGTEVYQDAGTSPFPFSFHVFIPRGIAGTHAVAGWEEGWSNTLIWVGDDGIVYKLDGYTPVPVSNDDVSRIIARALRDGQGSVLEASVHMESGDAIWKLTNPGLWTWELDVSTGNWNERTSFNRDDQRVSFSFRAFNRWISGDRETGKLFEVDDTYYREGPDPLRYILRSGAFAQFPSRLQIPRMDFDFTAAVGIASGEDPIQTDPTVLVRWSKDGGYSMSNPVTRRLGQQGVGNKRVTVLRGPTTGAKGLVVELEIDDPVHGGFMGGQAAVEQRAE